MHPTRAAVAQAKMIAAAVGRHGSVDTAFRTSVGDTGTGCFGNSSFAALPAARINGSPQPVSIRPEHTRLGNGEALGSDEVEISGLLHDIQYQGASTRFEIQLENGQNFCVSQANNQWQLGDAPVQPGQRVSARWARGAMVGLREDV